MRKLLHLSSVLALLLFFGYKHAVAQILITNGNDTKPTDSVHTLLELRNDTSDAVKSSPSKSLLLPITDSMRKRKLGETPKFPQGALVYDSSNRLIYVFSQGQWRALDTIRKKATEQPQSLDINQEDLESNPFSQTSTTSVQPSSSSTTNTDKNTLTIKTPSGYAPFEVKDEGNNQSSNNPYPLVHITYNGVSLTQGKDFTASLENGSQGSGGGTNQEKKIKVVFLTLSPEDWKGFSSFSAEYVPLR